jgi:hypothetical protein
MALISLSTTAAVPDLAQISKTPAADLGEEVLPLWVVFLVFVAILLMFGLLYARRYRRVEPRERGKRPSPKRGNRPAGESVMPLLIDVRDTVDEPVEKLQINIEDQAEVRTD